MAVLDVDEDLSFLSFARAARALRPAARVIAWEDYVLERVWEVFALVRSHPDQCLGRSFDVAMFEPRTHASFIVTVEKREDAWGEFEIFKIITYTTIHTHTGRSGAGGIHEFTCFGEPTAKRVLVDELHSMWRQKAPVRDDVINRALQ
jgi:hypothetical protein